MNFLNLSTTSQAPIHDAFRLLLGFLLCLCALPAGAHEIRPAVVDVHLQADGTYQVALQVNMEALLAGVSTGDRILLNTGRISSEMLLKGARMGVPLVVSRTSPTEMAVSLAEQLGITVVGYLRHDSFNLYAGGEALSLDEAGGTAPA